MEGVGQSGGVGRLGKGYEDQSKVSMLAWGWGWWGCAVSGVKPNQVG